MRPDGADAAAGSEGPAAASTSSAVTAATPDAAEERAAQPRASAPPRVARRELVLLFVAAVALQAIAWALLIAVVRRWFPTYWDVTIPDVLHYAEVAFRVHQGQWPYAQFSFEYPPLTLVPLLIPPDAPRFISPNTIYPQGATHWSSRSR